MSQGKIMQRYVSMLVLAAALLCAAETAFARALQQVLNTGTLRVGVVLFAPWGSRGANGELVGFEVDVARQLASDMGVKAEVFAYAFDRLIPALEAGEIDLIAAGLAITPERALHVNFSQPYAQGGIALATHSQKTSNVTGLGDLNDPARKIAVVADSVAFELAQRALPQAEIQVFESADAASAALVRGEVDGYLEDEPIPTFLSLEHPTIVDVPLGQPLLASPVGFAIAKGDPDFLAFLNSWIVAREADTWLPTTTSYWFKSLAWRSRLENAPRR
jgi:polar amino acid transport system substrate-binding protein